MHAGFDFSIMMILIKARNQYHLVGMLLIRSPILRFASALRGLESDAFAAKRPAIRSCTEFLKNDFVPEFGLHLLTPHVEDRLVSEFGGGDDHPYWSVFWPGGQVLSRHILNYPAIVSGKRILDLGCGSGAASIASLKASCDAVLANDVDENALAATELNLLTNDHCTSNVSFSNLDFLSDCRKRNAEYLRQNVDIILLGDMFYDQNIGDQLSELIKLFLMPGKKPNVKQVLVGDPGRWYLREASLRKQMSRVLCMQCIAKYEFGPDVKSQNFGLTQGFVYNVLLQLTSSGTICD